MGQVFAVYNDRSDPRIRGSSLYKTLGILGIPSARIDHLHQGPLTDSLEPLADIIPASLLTSLFDALHFVESNASPAIQRIISPTDIHDSERVKIYGIPAIPSKEINYPFSVQLPSQDSFKNAIILDPNLSRLVRILQNIEPFSTLGWSSGKVASKFAAQRFELDEGLVYRLKTTARHSFRQIRVLVVPEGMRNAVILACHASAMAEHMDRHKTY